LALPQEQTWRQSADLFWAQYWAEGFPGQNSPVAKLYSSAERLPAGHLIRTLSERARLWLMEARYSAALLPGLCPVAAAVQRLLLSVSAVAGESAEL
jgi:hypothetical protein